MKEECIICAAPLAYLEQEEEMECVVCHRKEHSKARCEHGHYVCNACHIKGVDAIVGVCMQETGKDPIQIMNKMMALPFCHMHGPEHHIMVGSALLAAYHNAGGKIDLEKALVEMQTRGAAVPGGACGFWGACGAGVSAGMFLSIVTGSTPLSETTWGWANQMTAKALDAIGCVGGPRCCKRNAYLAILAAADFVKEHLGIEMEKKRVICTRSASNNQCIGTRCPFFQGGNGGVS